MYFVLLCPERKGLVLDRAEALNDIERKKKPEKTKRKQKKKIVAKKVAIIVLQDEPFLLTYQDGKVDLSSDNPDPNADEDFYGLPDAIDNGGLADQNFDDYDFDDDIKSASLSIFSRLIPYQTKMVQMLITFMIHFRWTD